MQGYAQGYTPPQGQDYPPMGYDLPGGQPQHPPLALPLHGLGFPQDNVMRMGPEQKIQDAVLRNCNRKVDFKIGKTHHSVKCNDHHDLVEYWTKVLDHNYPGTKREDAKRDLTWNVNRFEFKVYTGTGTLVASGDWERCLNKIWSLIDNFENKTPNTDKENELVDVLRSIDAKALQKELSTGESVLWTGESVQAELELLGKGAIRKGQDFIHILWKSLLVLWFNAENTQIYIASPFLDADRLADIVQICLSSSHQDNLKALITRHTCFRDEDITTVKEKVFRMFDKDLQGEITHVFQKIITDVPTFHGKFFAAVKDDEAMVIVTSANLTADHFDWNNLETVTCLKMTKNEFAESFVDPMTFKYMASYMNV